MKRRKVADNPTPVPPPEDREARKKRLQEERAAIAVELGKIAEEEAEEQRAKFAVDRQLFLDHIDFFLGIEPKHNESLGCSDDKPLASHEYRRRCRRCALLDVKKTTWIDPDFELHLDLEEEVFTLRIN